MVKPLGVLVVVSVTVAIGSVEDLGLDLAVASIATNVRGQVGGHSLSVIATAGTIELPREHLHFATTLIFVPVAVAKDLKEVLVVFAVVLVVAVAAVTKQISYLDVVLTAGSVGEQLPRQRRLWSPTPPTHVQALWQDPVIMRMACRLMRRTGFGTKFSLFRPTE